MKKVLLILLLAVVASGSVSGFFFFSSDKSLFDGGFLTGYAVVEMSGAGPYEMTEWFNIDKPGGDGDYEHISDLKKRGLLTCDPLAIECVTAADGIDYAAAGEVYTCDLRFGGSCVNDKQADGKCLDYKVRLGCPVDESLVDIELLDFSVSGAVDYVIDPSAELAVSATLLSSDVVPSDFSLSLVIFDDNGEVSASCEHQVSASSVVVGEEFTVDICSLMDVPESGNYEFVVSADVHDQVAESLEDNNVLRVDYVIGSSASCSSFSKKKSCVDAGCDWVGSCVDEAVTCIDGSLVASEDDCPVVGETDLVARGYELVNGGGEAQIFVVFDEFGSLEDDYRSSVYVGFEEFIYMDYGENFDRDELASGPILTLDLDALASSWVETFYVLTGMDIHDAVVEVEEDNNCVRQEFKIIRAARGKVVNVVEVGRSEVGCVEGFEFVDLSEEQLKERYAGKCDGCPFGATCVPIGFRVGHEYCSLDGFSSQLGEGLYCENDFECSSNVCIEGSCVEQKGGVFSFLWGFLK